MLIESHPCRVDLSMATAHDHRCLLQLANVDGDVLLFEVKLGDQRMIQVLVFTCRLNSVEKRERFYTSTYGCGSNPCSFPGVPSLISNCSKYYCWFLSPIKLMVNIDQARHFLDSVVPARKGDGLAHCPGRRVHIRGICSARVSSNAAAASWLLGLCAHVHPTSGRCHISVDFYHQ